MEIKIGYALAKPVETQAQCDAYTAMVECLYNRLGTIAFQNAITGIVVI